MTVVFDKLHAHGYFSVEMKSFDDLKSKFFLDVVPSDLLANLIVMSNQAQHP